MAKTKRTSPKVLRIPLPCEVWITLLRAAVDANTAQDGGDKAKAPAALWKWVPQLNYKHHRQVFGVPLDDAYVIADYLLERRITPEITKLAHEVWLDSAP